VGVRSEANVTQDVLEVIAVEGLPSAYVVSRQTLTFRADSSPSALVGDGQLWLRQRSASQTTLRGMYYQDNVLRVSQEATQPIDERLAQLQPLIQSSGFEVVRHHRNEILATEGPHSNVQVIEGPSGVPLSQARCYAIDPDGGAARVLGTSGSAGELSGPLNGWSLLAIAADGRIAFNSPLSPATASVLQVGSLSVGQEHRPSQSQSLLLRMTAVGNNTPHGRLHATFWQYTVPNDWLMSNLPVGQYEAQLPSGEVIRGVQILADDTVVLN
jgi:hypothetical protein